MFKILEEENADHLAVAFDLSAPTFRHKMYDAYKAPENRAGRTAGTGTSDEGGTADHEYPYPYNGGI